MIVLPAIALIAAGLADAAFAAPAAAQVTQVNFDRTIADAKSVMMEDPGRALLLARRADDIARALPSTRAAAMDGAQAEWLQGEALSRAERTAEALPVLERALATVVRVAPADRLHGDLLLSRGWVRETRGEIAAGLQDFQNAFQIYRTAGEARGQAKALQNIAGIYQDAGDNERAQRYYAQAAEVYRGDPAFALAAYNNVGESLRMLGRYAAAARQFDLALTAARQVGSPLLQANVLTNLASTHLFLGDRKGATTLANQALALTANSSAADERPFVWGVLAQITMMRGDTAAAATYIGRTFKGVDLADSSLRYRDFHKLAADIYQREGRPELALEHLRAWKRLDDNIRAVAASTNAALMAAQFDFSTQNLRIAQLQANRAKLHETVLVVVAAGVSVVSGLLLIGLLSLRRSRNQTRGANQQLTKALQAKSDFLAMTSHEIRTPLNGILGMTQVMLADRQVAGPLRAKVEIVHGAGQTMQALVDDILDLSKMETGKLAIERTPVRLRRMLGEVTELWRAKAEAKGLTLTLDAADCPVLVEEDEARLRQILFNLLSNAVKFTDRGSVAVAVAVTDATLTITVADTGIGVAPAQHDLIFEKFQQADGSTSRRFGGTGLGLAICRNVATAMEGTITIDSEEGCGATFTLRLPLRVLDAPADDEVAAAVAPILLLEPNALTRRILAKALQPLGDVETCATAEEIVAALRSGARRHLVLHAAAARSHLDEVVRAGVAVGGRIAIMLGEDDDHDALSAAGAVLLRKPVTSQALVAALMHGDAANAA